MIKVEPCKGCGGVILVDDFMGLRVRCDPSPVDAQTATAALLAGLPLYRVVAEGGRPNQFAGASQTDLRTLVLIPGSIPLVAPHRCPTPKAPQSASQGVKGPGTPGSAPKALQSPPVAPGALFSAPSTAPPGATTAARPRSRSRIKPTHTGDGPRCDGCGRPCEDGTYGAIHLGELLVWAHHVESCGG